MPTMTSSRIQRWSLTLAAYHYTIVFRAGRDNYSADAMSRLPLEDNENAEEDASETVLRIDYLSGKTVTAKAIWQWTRRDPLLSQVYRHVMEGWPKLLDQSLLPYYKRRNELTVQDGCLLWSNRVPAH